MTGVDHRVLLQEFCTAVDRLARARAAADLVGELEAVVAGKLAELAGLGLVPRRVPRAVPVGSPGAVGGGRVTLRDRVLGVLPGRVGEIAVAVGEPASSVSPTLTRLVRDGLVAASGPRGATVYRRAAGEVAA